MHFLITFLASGAYLGYAPVASGTFGTLAAIPLFFLFDELRDVSTVLYLATYIGAVAASCWIAGQAEELFAEHDSGKIVIDEVVGFLATTLFITPTWTNIIVAFLIFRVADVIKPYPASLIDAKWPGGRGVTLDDVVSGLYSNLVMHALVAVGLLAR